MDPGGRIAYMLSVRVAEDNINDRDDNSNDRDNDSDGSDPRELSDGRLVCRTHGLVRCDWCCVDYSFMSEILGLDSDSDWDVDADDADSDDSGSIPSLASIPTTSANDTRNAVRRGTGRCFPTKFQPPRASATPLELFTVRKQHMFVTRYTLGGDDSTVLIRTDGACLGNGQRNPKAGWGFWHGIWQTNNKLALASHRLETKGPFGDDAAQTSNRAELRAVLAALRFRNWSGEAEGVRTLVIATDSVYVVDGATA